MSPPAASRSTTAQSIVLAGQALRMWTARQVLGATLAAGVVAVVIGTATVLIPNPVFGREIPPVWWNYPVWLLTSVLSGMLVATYLRPSDADASGDDRFVTPESEMGERRSSRMGVAGGILAWFAVGCPVCNKIALLALGYSGAITWFAPVQPLLAVVAMILTAVALVWRLRGQVSCPLPASAVAGSAE
ncbi:hypothetical protein IU449_06700 [Nocardia higoensis]|uniref:Integral membrane protein n=1 Tax=Nocardia higoensis TaxID=228599 RepID=A0ABS0D6X8_9NOCA|nr:hypothetical protein [Nocardia higoensis]